MSVMSVEDRVEAILNRKTFPSESVKDKTRAALLKSLRPIEAIKASDEDDSNEPNVIRNDDSDGVPCRSVASLMEEQQAKKDALRARSREMFSDNEPADEQDGGVMVAVDVNRKLKWGYTALHFAAIDGNEVECDRLLAAGADKSITDNSGKMAWQKAAFKGHDALAAKLKP